ncbi:MAG: hypothetical protein K1X57_03370 [Gemmataceae bacterium]|nr:hypothetical protein [Gemmataceae bacterium]
MAHSHAQDQNYYLDQICSVGACGALGIIAALMYQTDKLGLILAPPFHKPVLWGGIALIVLSAVRFISLWTPHRAAISDNGHKHDHANCDHKHEHEHEHEHANCDHNHEHDHTHHESCNDHDCGHEHSHAWTPAKYAVLLLPVILYLLELPNAGFSADRIGRDLVATELEGSDRVIATKSKLTLGYRELADAAHESAKRAYFEGHIVEVRGIYMPLNQPQEFTLVRLNMTCCAADAIPMQVRIVAPSPIQFKQGQWIAAEGKIEFRKVAGKDNKWIAVILLDGMDNVRTIPPEPNPYAY